MIAPEAGLSVSRQCTLLGVARSSFYYRPRPESAEERGTRASETARPDFHRPPSLRQPPAAGGAVAGGCFNWPPTGSATVAKARAVGGRAEAEHQQAASRARGLSVPSAWKNDRPAEPGVGSRHKVHPDASGISVPDRDHRLGDPAGAVLAAVEHACGGP